VADYLERYLPLFCCFGKKSLLDYQGIADAVKAKEYRRTRKEKKGGKIKSVKST
jgi:hypothetical protein